MHKNNNVKIVLDDTDNTIFHGVHGQIYKYNNQTGKNNFKVT